MQRFFVRSLALLGRPRGAHSPRRRPRRRPRTRSSRPTSPPWRRLFRYARASRIPRSRSSATPACPDSGRGALFGSARARPRPPTREEPPTVSSPPSSVSPAAGSAHARAGVVSAKPVTVSQGAASTVTGYRKGRSLTVKTPAGSLVEYRLAKDTILPADLGPGRQVLVETKSRQEASRRDEGFVRRGARRSSRT